MSATRKAVVYFKKSKTYSKLTEIFEVIISRNLSKINIFFTLYHFYSFAKTTKPNFTNLSQLKYMALTSRCTGSWEILARGEGQLREVPVGESASWESHFGEVLSLSGHLSPNWHFPQLTRF